MATLCSAGTDSVTLLASPTCNEPILIGEIDYRLGPGFQCYENTTFRSDGAQQLVSVKSLGSDDPLVSYDFIMRTLTVDNVDLTLGTSRFRFVDNDIALTLNNGVVDLEPFPSWLSSANLELQATGGNSVIANLQGSQPPTTNLTVASGARLTFFASGDTSNPLSFTAVNTGTVNGTLEIERSNVIYNTGDGFLNVPGTLEVNGSDTTFQVSNLSATGSVVLGPGENFLVASNVLDLNGGTMTLGNNARVSTSVFEPKGTSVVTVAQDAPFRFSTRFEADAIFPIGSGVNLTFNGFGDVQTDLFDISGLASAPVINLDGEVRFQLRKVTGAQSFWNTGSLFIGPDATFRNASNIFSIMPVALNGAFITESGGQTQPSGTWTDSGSGFMRIEANGTLGPFGAGPSQSWTAQHDIFMDDFSTMKVLLNPTTNSSQRVTATGLFGLGPNLGTRLELLVQNDVPLPPGTEYTLVDYSGTLVGRFVGLGEGDSITVGSNTFVLSYVGGDGTDITLTIPPAPVTPVTVGGVVTGLIPGESVVLQNNGGNDLTVPADGSFTFTMPVAPGSAYAVTVLTQPGPISELCSVGNGSGTAPSTNITNVIVTCSVNNFSVGGTVSGLASGQSVELLNRGGDAQVVSANGGFTFSPQADGTAYAVTVGAQPAGQSCSVANGSGTLPGGSNVTNVSVTCIDIPYQVGGLVTGLVSGESVVLQNNGGDNLTVSADGSFTFPTSLTNGDAYAVTVLTQPGPLTETCTVTNGSGTIAASDVTNVAVACAVETFAVGGSVTGLPPGVTVTLLNRGTDAQSVTGNSTFAFTAQADGTLYAVTVGSQPSGYICTVTNGSGTLSGANVSNVTVACAVVTPEPKAIPTLSVWMLTLLASLVAALGALATRRA